MKVPFVDLKTENLSLKNEIRSAIESCLENSRFVLGPDHQAFEEEFGRFLGGVHVAAVGSGTDALYLSLRVLGIGAGDEVIAPSHTFVATAESIVRAGAIPVFADIRPDTYCLDPSSVETLITTRTKVIMPVHLYGLPAEMDSILAIAASHGLRVIEDAAQAHGATFDDTMAGTLGDFGCFSFYPSKNLGALGDAGAVAGKDLDQILKIRSLCNHGRDGWHTFRHIGLNSRMDAIQAAVLRVKLPYLRQGNEKRRRAAAWYIERLSDVRELTLPTPPHSGKARHVYHLFVVAADHRDELAAHLARRGISCAIHYPVPVHLQPAYASLGRGKGSLPVTEKVSQRVLSLPIYPEITLRQIDAVVSAIREFFGT